MSTVATITYKSGDGTGAKDQGGTVYLTGSSHFMVSEKWGSCDLVQLIWAGADNTIDALTTSIGPEDDDEVVSETVIGFGYTSDPVNGQWTKTVTGNLPTGYNDATANKFYVRVFNDIKANVGPGDYYDDSGLTAITAPTTPTTIVAANLQTDTLIVPEPSFMLISGLALLLLRKRK
jgi:hypothetical protein